MKIRFDVEAEVPDRDTCNGHEERCKFLDITNNTILEYVCLIFDEYLQPDERYDALRCEQCLNATRVEE